MTTAISRLGRKNERLDMGSGNVTVSRDLLFAAMRQAVKDALLEGKSMPLHESDAALQVRAHGRASRHLDDLLNTGGGPERPGRPGRPELL